MSGQAPPFAGFDLVSGAGGGRPPEQSASPRTWLRDLALGARFAAGGGREGWTRTILTAVGVGLGVAMLLLAAAVPAMMNTRDQKRVARDTVSPAAVVTAPTDRSLLIENAGTTYHGKDITGTLVHAEGPAAQVPPGVRALPPAGHMVVSPALKKLLASAPLLRERVPYTIDGTIGQAGLMGPAELYYYAGSDHLVARDADFRNGNAMRVLGFGHHSNSDVMGPAFELLLVIMLVVLLLPVVVFIGTAVRLGGERRDRRLAAMRLVGADIRMTRRIAAGEALFGAVFGLVLGAVLFLLGRQLASHFTIRDISAYPSDMTPNTTLTVLIVLAVPITAVVVTMLGLRGTVIEPLGVVRKSVGRRRRLWWRLLIPAVGLALLAPLFGTVKDGAQLLIGVTAVLPWLVETVVGRLHGGPVAWQLATRRLQLSSSASARMVSGVTVAVAGAIALQMLFGGVSGDFVSSTGADPNQAQAQVSGDVTDVEQAQSQIRQVAATKGVKAAYGYVRSQATQPDADKNPRGGTAYLPLSVGDCPTLRKIAAITSCFPGSVFLVPVSADGNDDAGMREYARPGAQLDLNVPDGPAYSGSPKLWTIPASARTVPGRTDALGDNAWGILSTPQALSFPQLPLPSSEIAVTLDKSQPDAIEYLRNTGAKLGVNVFDVRSSTERSSYTQLRRALFAGATLTLALIGASLLVTMLEQLRDRKKLLAVLVAFGTRRSALAWSVLWQTAIPVVLGLLLACVGGVGLGWALLAMVGRGFHADWGSVMSMSGIGAGIVLAVTLLSLPPLWRLMRADGLRTE
jgi:hypothetical protein